MVKRQKRVKENCWHDAFISENCDDLNSYFSSLCRRPCQGYALPWRPSPWGCCHPAGSCWRPADGQPSPRSDRSPVKETTHTDRWTFSMLSQGYCFRWRHFTSMRKSPILRPALQATPPSSTDSRYCRAGNAGVGVNSSMGVWAKNTEQKWHEVYLNEVWLEENKSVLLPLAPLSTNPKPSLSFFCRSTVFSLMI